MTSAADALAGSALFAGLAAEDREWLLARSALRRFRRGQVLFVEGDPAEWLLVLAGGRLKVSVYSPNGDELIVDTVAAGQAVGELGVLAGARRSATVEALSDSQGWCVPREAIVDLLARRPALASSMLVAIAQRVHQATGAAADLVFLDLPRRVAKYLLEHRPAPPGESVVDLGMSQGELAARLGASRQRVNAALAEFERRGWISLNGRTVTVNDAPALEALLRT